MQRQYMKCSIPSLTEHPFILFVNVILIPTPAGLYHYYLPSLLRHLDCFSFLPLFLFFSFSLFLFFSFSLFLFFFLSLFCFLLIQLTAFYPSLVLFAILVPESSFPLLGLSCSA